MVAGVVAVVAAAGVVDVDDVSLLEALAAAEVVALFLDDAAAVATAALIAGLGVSFGNKEG